MNQLQTNHQSRVHHLPFTGKINAARPLCAASPWTLTGLALLFASVSLLSLFALPSPARAESPPPTSATAIVEYWSGIIIDEQTNYNTYASCPWVCVGNSHTLEIQTWRLQVDENGALSGSIETELVDYSYQQTKTNNSCGPVAETNYTLDECKFSNQLTQPNSVITVQGVRELEAFTQKPILKITVQDEIQECKAHWSAQGIHSSTGATVHKQEDVTCSSGLYVPQTFYITTYTDGRAPQIDMSDSSSAGGVSSRRMGHLTVSAQEPMLELDRELLERSIFLDQVPVEEKFTADLSWNSPDGGWVTWQLADAEPDRVGPTEEDELPKPINNGMQGVGKKQLTVQAQNTLNIISQPEVTQLTVAPPPGWAGAPSDIAAFKVGDGVTYKGSLKFPDPAFEGNVNVPALVPWLGGKKLGIVETQGSFAWEAQSTSEGQGSLSGQTGFVAMGGSIIGSLGGRAKVVLGENGVEIPEGGIDFGIGGTIASEPEPLLKVVPSLNPALIAIQRISPRAAAFISERAQIKLEMQPKFDFGFNFETQNDEIKFKDAQAKPSFGFKTILEIKLIEDVLQATASVGGTIAAVFQVPEPYIKEVTLQGLVQAQVTLYRLAWEGEKAWSEVIHAAASMANAVNQHMPESSNNAGSWQPLSRAYLDQPNYAQWHGDALTAQALTTEPTNDLLVENVFPLANPSLSVWTNLSGQTRQAQAWAHDNPDAPALSGGEIAFSRNNGSSWQAPTFVTDDEHEDLAPKVAYMPNNFVMVLWQRMDTTTPPDFNDDPAGYLSHWQIAARIAGGVAPLQQLSTSGSLNYRHQIGALDSGALAVWVNNPANQLLGDSANPDHLLFAHYTIASSSWSTPTQFVTNLAGLLSLDLATTGNLGALVYAVDMDDDDATTADRELFYATWNGSTWSAATRLTNNSVADENPELVLADDGSPLLVWQQNGVLKFLRTAWNGTPSNLPLPGATERPDYELVRSSDGFAALVWQEVGPATTQVGYALYDMARNAWSDERTLAHPTEEGTEGTLGSMATSIAAALLPADEDNEREVRLVLAYQLAHVDAVTHVVDGITIPDAPTIGQHDLRVATLPLQFNLTVTPSDLSMPTANEIRAIIHNTGERVAEDVPIVLHVGSADPVTGATTQIAQTVPFLAPGAATTVTFSIANRTETIFTVEIDPERTLVERDLTDNVAGLGTDLTIILLPAHYTPEGTILRAQVSQLGPRLLSPIASAMLTLDEPNGENLGGAQVGFPLAPTESITVTALISTARLGAGRHQLYWTLDPSNTLGDRNLSNNVAGTTVMIMPDLAAPTDRIHFDTAPGNTANLQLTVQNVGNWTSSATTLEVFDASPDNPNAHSLLQLPLPAIPPGEQLELSGLLQLAGIPAATAGLSGIYIQLDVAGSVEESNENNNVVASGAVLEGRGLVENSPLLLPFIKR